MDVYWYLAARQSCLLTIRPRNISSSNFLVCFHCLIFLIFFTAIIWLMMKLLFQKKKLEIENWLRVINKITWSSSARSSLCWCSRTGWLPSSETPTGRSFQTPERCWSSWSSRSPAPQILGTNYSSLQTIWQLLNGLVIAILAGTPASIITVMSSLVG